MNDQNQKIFKVKKTNCPSCGAPKRCSSDFSYLYCDYCGSYTDFDLSNAFKVQGPLYDIEYGSVIQRITAEKEKAAADRNEEMLISLGIELYTLHMEKAPFAWSIRIKDKSYRTQIIEYMGRLDALKAMDAELIDLNQKMIDTFSSVKMSYPNGMMMYDSEGMWNYYLAWFENNATSMLKWERSHFNTQHPDRTDPRIMIRSSVSAFLQGMDRYMLDDVKQKIIVHSGLSSQYIPIDNKDMLTKTCGRCGAPLTSFPDAHQKLCEYCGYIIDVGNEDFNCTGCGMPLSLPVTDEELKCPACSTVFKIPGPTKYPCDFTGDSEEILEEMLENY